MSSDDRSISLPAPRDYPGGPLILAGQQHKPFMCDPFYSHDGCSWPNCGCLPDSPLVTAILARTMT